MKYLVFVIPFILISVISKAQVSREQAINIIASEVVGIDSLNGHHLYSRYEKMNFNDTLWLDGNVDYYIAPYNESWVFFVDLAPSAFWAHDCQIIFFDVANSDYVINDDDWPPNPFLGGMTQFLEEWEWVLSVGMETKKVNNTNSFNIYPNPFSEEISIAYSSQIYEHLLIKIIDLAGKTVSIKTRKKEVEKNGIIRINTNKLEHGLYFVQISGNNKIFYTGKIIK